MKSSRYKAHMQPLEGKYYGTEIKVEIEGAEPGFFLVWIHGDYTPSERELAAWDEEEYGPYEISDSHYETQDCYELCKRIVTGINRG